jgi:ADP-heptose:LPS heptosyltransferase
MSTGDASLHKLNSAVFIGCNALGDTLCTTPVLRAFRTQHPAALITYILQSATYCHVLDGNPDVDLVLYSEHLWLHGLSDFSLDWLRAQPLCIVEPAALFRFDINGVCAHAASFQEHIATGFSKLLGIPIASVRPVIAVNADERRQAAILAPRPYAVLSAHTNAKPTPEQGLGTKEWPFARWCALVNHLVSRRGLDVIAIGAERDPRLACAGVRPLYGLPIKVVAALLEGASCVVTLENGIAHLCAAVDAPTLVLYSNVVPLGWARAADSPRVRILHGDPLQMGVHRVCRAVDAILDDVRPKSRRRAR